MTKRKGILSTIALSVALTLTMTITASAATLSYWYSDASTIGKWSSSPKVWYNKMDSSASFAFLSGLLNGASVWNSALGTTVDVSSGYTTAPIKFYGGTAAQIEGLGIFGKVPDSYFGLTVYTKYTTGGTHTYNGTNKTCVFHQEITGYIVSRSDLSYDNYICTASHEMGHSMGWHGHPSSSQPAWVMQQGKLENTVLATGEKNHLSQIY